MFRCKNFQTESHSSTNVEGIISQSAILHLYHSWGELQQLKWWPKISHQSIDWFKTLDSNISKCLWKQQTTTNQFKNATKAKMHWWSRITLFFLYVSKWIKSSLLDSPWLYLVKHHIEKILKPDYVFDVGVKYIYCSFFCFLAFSSLLHSLP